MKHHPPPGAIGRARRLRKRPTQAEQAMWRLLRAGFPGVHFRKQVPLRHFVVDFACHRAKLIIEVDGGQHGSPADADRTRILEAEGYRVLRFWNNDVLGNADGVYTMIAAALHRPHPHPASSIKGEK